MKSYSSREIIKILEEDGWRPIGIRGDHHYFKHEEKSGKITVPHPEKDGDPKVTKTIFKMAGVSAATTQK